VVFFRVDQISERTMARKLSFRFGFRDVLTGRLRVAQGRRGHELGLLRLPQSRRRRNENHLRMKQHNPGHIQLKKPAASFLSAGFIILAMMMLCR
jgi:hypothetical protein